MAAVTGLSNSVRTLSKALDQAAEALDLIHREDLRRPTPCADWRVWRLADHLVDLPSAFLATMRGETVDWSDPPHRTEAWGPDFRVAADDLIHTWHLRDAEQPDSSEAADMQSAELSVHTWDLLTALGRSTDRLDPEPAERGLAYLRANLTPERRGETFGPEQPAPADADAHTRLAAYAGRRVA